MIFELVRYQKGLSKIQCFEHNPNITGSHLSYTVLIDVKHQSSYYCRLLPEHHLYYPQLCTYREPFLLPYCKLSVKWCLWSQLDYTDPVMFIIYMATQQQTLTCH